MSKLRAILCSTLVVGSVACGGRTPLETLGFENQGESPDASVPGNPVPGAGNVPGGSGGGGNVPGSGGGGATDPGSGGGSTPGSGGGGGGTTPTPTTTTEPPQPPVAQPVSCGSSQCSSAEECCVDVRTLAQKCVSKGSCSGGVELSCKSKANCGPGQICCLSQGGQSFEATCTNSCGGGGGGSGGGNRQIQLCQTDAECGPNQACIQDSRIGIGACVPQFGGGSSGTADASTPVPPSRKPCSNPAYQCSDQIQRGTFVCEDPKAQGGIPAEAVDCSNSRRCDPGQSCVRVRTGGRKCLESC